MATRRNGTLFAIVVLKFTKSHSKELLQVVHDAPLTHYIVPKDKVFNLMSENISQVGVAVGVVVVQVAVGVYHGVCITVLSWRGTRAHTPTGSLT